MTKRRYKVRDRVLEILRDNGGQIADKSGRATTKLAELLDRNKEGMISLLRSMKADEEIDLELAPTKCYRIWIPGYVQPEPVVEHVESNANLEPEIAEEAPEAPLKIGDLLRAVAELLDQEEEASEAMTSAAAERDSQISALVVQLDSLKVDLAGAERRVKDLQLHNEELSEDLKAKQETIRSMRKQLAQRASSYIDAEVTRATERTVSQIMREAPKK